MTYGQVTIKNIVIFQHFWADFNSVKVEWRISFKPKMFQMSDEP